MCLAVLVSDHRSEMNRIVIVDDHPAFRAWARAVLAADGFRVAGEAADAASALAEVQAVRADAVLAARPRPAVILTSSRDAAAYAADLARTGLPFIAKEDLSGSAIRAMLGGRG